MLKRIVCALAAVFCAPLVAAQAQQSASINQPIAVIKSAGASAVAGQTVNVNVQSKDDKVVALVVMNDQSVSDPQNILPAPYLIRLSASKNQKVHWCVFNNLDHDIGKVEIIFNDPAVPLADGPKYTTGAVLAGGSVCLKSTQSKPVPKTTTYHYKVNVYDASGKLVAYLDPDVEVAN